MNDTNPAESRLELAPSITDALQQRTDIERARIDEHIEATPTLRMWGDPNASHKATAHGMLRIMAGSGAFGNEGFAVLENWEQLSDGEKDAWYRRPIKSNLR